MHCSTALWYALQPHQQSLCVLSSLIKTRWLALTGTSATPYHKVIISCAAHGHAGANHRPALVL